MRIQRKPSYLSDQIKCFSVFCLYLKGEMCLPPNPPAFLQSLRTFESCLIFIVYLKKEVAPVISFTDIANIYGSNYMPQRTPEKLVFDDWGKQTLSQLK